MRSLVTLHSRSTQCLCAPINWNMFPLTGLRLNTQTKRGCVPFFTDDAHFLSLCRQPLPSLLQPSTLQLTLDLSTLTKKQCVNRKYMPLCPQCTGADAVPRLLNRFHWLVLCKLTPSVMQIFLIRDKESQRGPYLNIQTHSNLSVWTQSMHCMSLLSFS